MTRTPTMQPFSLRDPLPSGITVLEASAGTGKTFAIVALAVRYIAEGRRPDELLLMTFTTAATSELRERLRRALNDARDGSCGHVDARHADAPDELAEILADAPADVVRDRIQRLDYAIANFDAVTVATTHSFCHQVLRGLGVAGDVDADAGFVEDLEGLVEEVVDDIYAREYVSGPGAPPFDHATARGVGRTAVRQAFAELTPHALEPVTPAECRVAFAFDVRAEVDRRKRRAGLLTYDDLQGRLRDVLIDPARGPVVAERLRTRFSVVLIDEFQDTDPVQYRIVYEAFARSGTALVLIGDPKQAIYGFRGADVRAYLAAAHAATDRRSMTTSWRSDADLLRACDGLFGAARLGDPEIVYQRLEAAARSGAPRPRGLPDGAPLRVRVVHREDLAAGDLTGATILAPRAREIVAGDLASDVVRLLADDNEITPGQIAVLVRKRSHATLIRDALRAAGVPAVISQVGSVFATAVALEWLRLLEAIDRSSSRSAVAAAALTVFCGWDAERVSRADDLRVGRPPRDAGWLGRAVGRARGGGPAGRHRRRPGPVRPRAEPARWRAGADRPAPSGRAAACRCGGRAPSCRRPCRLACRADPDGRHRHRQRRAQPPSGVGRSGSPGLDDPRRQGPGVSGRLLPVPVGRRLDSRRAQTPRRIRCSTPRPACGR